MNFRHIFVVFVLVAVPQSCRPERLLHQAVALDDFTQLNSAYKTENLDINEQDAFGRTALHLAAQVGNFAMTMSLLGHLADPSAIDKNGRTPLHYAALHADKNSGPIAKCLVDFGADVDKQDKNNETALAIARRLENKAVLAILLTGKPEGTLPYSHSESSTRVQRPMIKRFYSLGAVRRSDLLPKEIIDSVEK